jgi:hypothetical protein
MLIGWNDADQAWILRNSWGEGWGEDGIMRISYTAANVACAAVYATYDQPAPFQMFSPANGTLDDLPPTFYWTKGDYDLFKIYLYLPFYGLTDPVPIELGWTTDNFKDLPASWWAYLKLYAWAGSWVLGVNTSTLDYEVLGPRYFMRIP